MMQRKVVKGKTAILRTSLEVADSFSRKKYMQEVVPAKIPEDEAFSSLDYPVKLVAFTLPEVKNFAIFKSQEKFTLTINGVDVQTNFFSFVGSANFSISKFQVDTIVSCFFS